MPRVEGMGMLTIAKGLCRCCLKRWNAWLDRETITVSLCDDCVKKIKEIVKIKKYDNPRGSGAMCEKYKTCNDCPYLVYMGEDENGEQLIRCAKHEEIVEHGSSHV